MVLREREREKQSVAYLARTSQDAYSKTPLPYIIGTKEFIEDEYCGLWIPVEGS